MALLLAPYNEAMRLGMGFNSYTQTLCINDVVQKPGGIPATERDLRLRDHAAAAGKHAKTITAAEGAATVEACDESGVGVKPGGTVVIKRSGADGQNVVSQVVTWEAQFIDSMSDITNKLNISGSLAIKIAGTSGAGGGVEAQAHFLDEKIFSKGRKNYIIHVKVVNQHLYTEDVTQFCPIKNVQPGQFTDVYGDSYISGFLEGGQFNAVVSIDTSDNSTLFDVGGKLAVYFQATAVEVKGSAEGGKVDKTKKVDATTDIKVSWSGGGDIKDDKISDWDVVALRKVAMEFPDRVAACPQRINAIITKYTALRSYHEQTALGSPLDYENAGIYTSSLLDAYMEYKILWRNIQTLAADLEANKGEIELAPEMDGLETYRQSVTDAYDKRVKHYAELTAPVQSQEIAVMRRDRPPAEPKEDAPLPPNAVKPYPANILGLDKAKRDCRFEMIKIVREVDAVSRDPHVAVDPERNWQYLTPAVFKRLLPVKKESPPLPDRKEWNETLDQVKAKDEAIKKKDAELKAQKDDVEQMRSKLQYALTSLKRAGPNVMLLSPSSGKTTHEKLQQSIATLAHKVRGYRMAGPAGSDQPASSNSVFFNDLDFLDASHIPTNLQIWSNEGKIRGVKINYSNGVEKAHGVTEGNAKQSLGLSRDSGEFISELEMNEIRDASGNLSLARIAAATTQCRVMAADKVVSERTHNFSMTSDKQWSFRGFFGFQSDKVIETLGVIWGRDGIDQDLQSRQTPPARNFLALPTALQDKTRALLTSSDSKRGSSSFYVGDSVNTALAQVATGESAPPATVFTALDKISDSWKIESITFAAHKSTKQQLKGLKVVYAGQTPVVHGTVEEDDEVWSCNLPSPVIAAKLTVGKHENSSFSFVNAVEFVCGNADGSLPEWPLDIATVRYLGAKSTSPEETKVVGLSSLTENAPSIAGENYTLKGFYGEECQGRISRLGLIWGCA